MNIGVGVLFQHDRRRFPAARPIVGDVIDGQFQFVIDENADVVKSMILTRFPMPHLDHRTVPPIDPGSRDNEDFAVVIAQLFLPDFEQTTSQCFETDFGDRVATLLHRCGAGRGQ